MPNFRTLQEIYPEIPSETLDIIKNYVVNESFTPAKTVTYTVPVTVTGTYKWINGVKTLIKPGYTTTKTLTRQVPESSTKTLSGQSLLQKVSDLLHYTGAHTSFVAIDEDTFSIHTMGIRFTDPQGVRQDIPPRDVYFDRLSDGRIKITYSNQDVVHYANEVDPTKFITSFVVDMEVVDGVVHNRSLINGLPYDQVNIRSLITQGGKTNQDFVWRWWGYMNNPSGNIVDGNVTAITQHARTSEEAKSVNIELSPVDIGGYNPTTRTFVVPNEPENNPVFIRLQAEFLPANFKQHNLNCWFQLYQWGEKEAGVHQGWPTKEFDPNRELY